MGKKKEKKFNEKKFIIAVLFIVVLVYVYMKVVVSSVTAPFNEVSTNTVSKSSGYNIIKADSNMNYSGVGQEKVSDKDGYFTTFTTSDKNKKTYIDYKQGGNASWSQNKYWGGTMNENGCGITVMSTILSGYNKHHNPENLRKKYQPVLNYDNMSSELSSQYGIRNSNFYYDAVHLSSENIISHLKSNRPVIICVWNKPKNNRWTTSSHYMSLLACDDHNIVYVANPNGGENDSKSSGWYNIDEVTPYIAKALFIESYT